MATRLRFFPIVQWSQINATVLTLGPILAGNADCGPSPFRVASRRVRTKYDERVLYAFLDTTVLHKANLLRGPEWDSIKNALDAGIARVAISQVTVAELHRQTKKDTDSLAKKLLPLIDEAERLEFEFVVPPIDIHPEWRDRFGARAVDLGIEIVPLPSMPHESILERDLAELAPFKSSGEGYRDTLIWVSFLDWLSDVSPDAADQVFFVTDNTTQFAHERSRETTELVANLHREAQDSAHSGASLLRSRKDLVAEIRLAATPDPSVDHSNEDIAVSAALAKVGELAGVSVEFDGGVELDGHRMDSRGDLAPITEAAIEEMVANASSAEAYVVDVFDEVTEIWQVTLEAVAHVEGMVHKADFESLPAGVEIYDADWNDYYMWVRVELPLAFVVDVRTEMGGEVGYSEIVSVESSRSATD